MNYGYIYKTTNLINNKIYIGQKKGEFNPKYYGSGLIIKNEIKEGEENQFKVELITYAKNINELNQLETKFIEEYRKIFKPENIYNIKNGGQDISPMKGRSRSKETIDKMIKTRKQTALKKGYYHSQETINKISNSHMGKKASLEVRKKLSEIKRGISLERRGHKNICQCCICKTKRGEIKGKNHPMFGKKVKAHNDPNCPCCICKTKRGESKGDKSPNWKGNKIKYKRKEISEKNNYITFFS